MPLIIGTTSSTKWTGLKFVAPKSRVIAHFNKCILAYSS
jgi:hypothetical protein